MSKQIDIFQDMDGCITAFDKGYHTLTGIDISGEFVSSQDFWQPISEAGHNFWANLEWCEDGRELWDYISKYRPYILSAPSREESSKIGKRMWLEKHLPKVESHKIIFCPRWEKMKYANENSLLIDDMESTIEEWEQNGGIGILHTSTKSTIKQLKKLEL